MFGFYSWPAWVVLVLSVLLALILRLSGKARAASWTPLVALVLLLVGLELCRFDAQPVLSDKFDFTWFAWTSRAVRRIPMGVALLFLGPLIARAATELYGERRVFWAGMLASVPLSMGLIASGAIYIKHVHDMGEVNGLYREMLQTAHFAGNAALMVGASLSLVTALLMVTRIVSRRAPGSPQTF